MALTKAIVVLPDKLATIAEVPVPKLRDGWLLVKVKAVALNPTDWKHIDYGYADAGSRIGCDYAGIVEAVGRNVTEVNVGDHVAGFVHGGNSMDHETGAFGEYIITKPCTQITIPDNLSFEQAATITVSAVTCGLGLYKSLKLPLPNSPTNEPYPLLIHGGSTTTGLWGVQFAKASGLTVIATASPANFEHLRLLGADAVFDYHSPSCAADIRDFTKNKLRHAWDCIGATGSEALCAGALSDSEPSTYGAINMSLLADANILQRENPLVKGPIYIVAYDAIAEPYEWNGSIVPANLEEMEFAKMFLGLTRQLLEDGTIKPINPTVNRMGSGLEGVMKGLDELRAGKVSATKLVYTL